MSIVLFLGDWTPTRLSVQKIYQLCEKQSPTLLIDELDRHFERLKQQEPYRSHLTIYNRTNSPSSPLLFSSHPFFRISPLSNNNQTSFTINRILHPRPLVSPLIVFPDLDILNQTALNHLIRFNNDYALFLQQADQLIKSYQSEYNQDSLITRRIFLYKDYHQCLPSANQTNGLQNLMQLLNHFLQQRLGQFNTKLMDKQIRVLEKMTDNRTLIEHLNRIQLEFKTIEQIIPLQNGSNASCIIELLDQLLDKRFQLDELPSKIHLYSPNDTEEYFISNDWPYVMTLYERLLKDLPIDTLVNYVFFDSYRQIIYPYYQPHIHRSIEFERSHPSCHVESCFDIFNCYHPSLLNQIIDVDNQVIEFVRSLFACLSFLKTFLDQSLSSSL